MGKHIVTATIYDKAGNVLSHAQNNYNKSHPIQAAFARQAGMPERIYLHAEMLALVRLGRRASQLKGNDRPYRISIERYTKDGKPAPAAPCAVCLAALKHYNIVKVEHTI